MRTSSPRVFLFALAAAWTIATAGEARAAEVTRVASSFDEDNRFDVHFGVAYDYNFKRASILREWNGGGPGDENQPVKDLLYRHQRHTLTPTLEIGLWHDLAVYVSLPIVLYDTRDYGFDQSQDDCVYGEQVPPRPNATCVNKSNSTTIRDEIIPSNGFDATDRNAPFDAFTGPATEKIFQGPVRRGLDQLHVGIKYGILNQARRSHLPTWIVGVEGRFAVGRAMTFSRNIVTNDPAGNHRVGRRIHELGVFTALSRRYAFMDPFFTAYWRQSLRATGSKFQNFDDEGAQDVIRPQSTAGVSIGAEFVPFERKAKSIKVAIVIAGSAVLHYGGRGYSEIWELLADSPALVGSFDPTSQATANGSPLAPGRYCDRDAALAFARANPGDPGYVPAGGGSCQKFEGITDLQDYGTFGFTGGLNLHLGPYTRLAFGVNLQTDTRHFITFANRGEADVPGSGGTQPEQVDPGTIEVNPLRRDVVDNVGRRYVVDGVIDTYGYFRLLFTF